MRKYSLTLVLKASLNEAKRKKLLETVKAMIKTAKFSKEEELGEKELAYPINRETKGFYTNFLFESEQDFAADFGKRLSTNEDVLRFLFLKTK